MGHKTLYYSIGSDGDIVHVSDDVAHDGITSRRSNPHISFDHEIVTQASLEWKLQLLSVALRNSLTLPVDLPKMDECSETQFQDVCLISSAIRAHVQLLAIVRDNYDAKTLERREDVYATYS